MARSTSTKETEGYGNLEIKKNPQIQIHRCILWSHCEIIVLLL